MCFFPFSFAVPIMSSMGIHYALFSFSIGSLHELILDIQAKCGKDFPIIVRWSVDEFLGEDGRGVEESKILAQWMERDGVAALDCEAAVFESVEWMIPTIYQAKGNSCISCKSHQGRRKHSRVRTGTHF